MKDVSTIDIAVLGNFIKEFSGDIQLGADQLAIAIAAYIQTNYVVITHDVYDGLLEDSQFLSALESAGVDNWDGFDEAREIMREWNGE